MKVLRKNLSEGRKQICKIVRKFYVDLYKGRSALEGNAGIPKAQNQGYEDIPDITLDEINNSLKDMKKNKSPGDDPKMGGTVGRFCTFAKTTKLSKAKRLRKR